MTKLFSLSVTILFLACSSKKDRYNPSEYLSVKEKDLVKEIVVRYAGKAPRRVADTLRLDSAYDEHFARAAKNYFLDRYYIDENGNHFFLISKRAPSMEEKWVATGGRMSFENDFDLVEYEEIFRTWKMKKEDLDVRARYLFSKMVKNEDLTSFYTDKAGFNYIEFPDQHVFFDKETKTWKSNLYRSVEEIVYESRDSEQLLKK